MNETEEEGLLPTQNTSPEYDELSILANQIVQVLMINDDDKSTPSQPSDSNLLTDGSVNFQARSYQVEMLEESLKRNIIVAADTGSGKTHIAVLRMLHELDHIAPDQRIWFLAPTVALCSQQYETIQSQISNVQVKFLSGADGVDRWTIQSLWDDILKNVKIVVCTYQILLDCLTHGFTNMSSVALIVFDEAHNCVGKNAGAKIMNSFYHPNKANNLASPGNYSVPHILGLTASPVMRSSATSLGKIEETLDAICRTPTKHRAELRLQVNRPVLSQIYYQRPPPAELSHVLQSLTHAFEGLDVEEDPYVKYLQKYQTEKGKTKLLKIRLNRKTFCYDQMKSFLATSLRVCTELGEWAADYYIAEVISNFLKGADLNQEWGTSDLSSAEKQYLAAVMREISNESNGSSRNNLSLSDKVKKMIEALLQQPAAFSGIIFVQERAVVAVLCNILRIHPETQKFRVGMMVGTSVSTRRTRNISELIDVGAQKNTLSLFKSGALNVLIATSVLEEGIDVPACNLVICFQKPANLKSFVQRRGRARHQESKLVIMLDSTEDKRLSDWESLENEMKAFYEDEMRSLQEVLAVEDTEETTTREYRVPGTNALLDLDNAIQHLYHFCATLPPTPYVDLRPEFICFEAGNKLVRAKVHLPVSVDKAVRVAESRNSWMSERNAIKDAAFEAYLALYKSGLVNDNMLPLLRHDAVTDDLKTSAVETRASIMVVDEKLDPWIDVAQAWQNPNGIWSSTIFFNGLEIRMVLPVEIPALPSFLVYWSAQTELPVTLEERNQVCDPEAIVGMLKETLVLFQVSFGRRFAIQNEAPVVLFSFKENGALDDPLSCQPAATVQMLQQPTHSGLVREVSNSGIPYILKQYLLEKPSRTMVQHPYENYDDIYNESPHLSVEKLPKRVDFLHRVPIGNHLPSEKLHSSVLPVTQCTVDKIDFKYVQFGLMVPSIIRRLETYIQAWILSTTILSEVQIQDLSLVVTAISASSAREGTNYQRLEFIGDSILKLCTSVQLMAQYLLWHQGYLSAKKDRVVSNARLSRAAVEIGLAKFIITKSFTGKKWRPLYVSDLLHKSRGGTREMSSKVLADVVEALVGASMVDGGIEKALVCLQVFIPEQEFLSLETRRLFLFSRAVDIELPPALEPLEALIGYKFRKKSLLIEAMSHSSNTTGSSSYERLEFLGDSILDYIVVETLRTQELSHIQMHLLRTALVNADFLAFLCMEWAIKQERVDLTNTEDEEITRERKIISMPLWRFMRHQSPMVGEVQMATAKRHAELRGEIVSAMETGSRYPWALLARLQAMKFYSDLVESLLGALWIDSGSFDVCRSVVAKMGILPYLQRILGAGVDVWHPKEKLGLLAVEKIVKYIIEPRSSTTIPPGEKSYACQVSVGDEQIVIVEGGVSKEEVMTKAADAAVLVLTARAEERELGTENIGTLADDLLMGDTAREVQDYDVEMAL